MAINQNHLFEELNGVKCAIVEKNVAAERVDFLRRLLEYNGLTVVAVPSPPPKTPPSSPPAAGSIPPAASSTPSGITSAPSGITSAPSGTTSTPSGTTPVPPPPGTFTVGVTNVMFNPVNAIFGRLLKTPDGHTVTLAYWQQQEKEPDDEKPYFERR